MKTPLDSTGKPIEVGDKVRFRGQEYTIKCFLPGQGTFGTCGIEFEEPQHFPEQACEISVDFIRSK